MLYGPGNDLVSATAMTAAGAHMILFTTGRGTPFGAPAPTLKLSTNSQLAENKKSWIDFDAGSIVSGETIDESAKRLLELQVENKHRRNVVDIEAFQFLKMALFYSSFLPCI